MKLTDKKFLSKKVVSEKKVTKKQIRAVLDESVAFEQLFDLIAQMGGPDMVNHPPGETDAPMANPGDVTDVTDVWPEGDIQRQVRDLRSQGLDDMAIFNQLIDMQVLGTPSPMMGERNWLFDIVKTAQEDKPEEKKEEPKKEDKPEEKKEEPKQKPDLNQLDVKDLMKSQPLEYKKQVMKSFLAKLSELKQKSVQLSALIDENEKAYGSFGKIKPKYNRRDLQRALERHMATLERAATIYGKLASTLALDEHDEHLQEIGTWLNNEIQNTGLKMKQELGVDIEKTKDTGLFKDFEPEKRAGQLRPLDVFVYPLGNEHVKVKSVKKGRGKQKGSVIIETENHGTMTLPDSKMLNMVDTSGKEAQSGGPAGSAAAPIDGQRETVSQPEISGTGKIGQMAPPANPEPAPGQDGMDMPDLDGMDLPDDMASDDMRSLSEVIEDVKSDIDVMTQKIENGETILHGHDLEPVEDDTGATPAPGPSKVAVDQPAKNYWKSYYKDYGSQLVKDRHASVLDIVDSVFSEYGKSLGTKEASNIADYVVAFVDSVDDRYNKLALAAVVNQKFAKVLDTTLVNYMARTGSVGTVENKPSMMMVAVESLGLVDASRIAAFADKIAAGMKSPSVKGQPDDQVKLDKMEDKADSDDNMLARPAHLPMEVVEMTKSGIYLKITVEWDPDHAAAKRSDAGMKHAVISFVKGLESKKEFTDLGFLGKVVLDELDIEAGMAVCHVRTNKADAPVVTKEHKQAQMAAPGTPMGPGSGDNENLFSVGVSHADGRDATMQEVQELVRSFNEDASSVVDEGNGVFLMPLPRHLAEKFMETGNLQEQFGDLLVQSEMP